MKTYKIYYTFDGEGVATVKANNVKEAKEKYDDGNWECDKEGGQNYEIDKIEEDN